MVLPADEVANQSMLDQNRIAHETVVAWRGNRTLAEA
jgi:hypothetical protein